MAFQILTSVPIPVLQGICGAGLQRRKALDLDMYAWLTNNLRKSESRPTIYMIELTDDIGRPLKYEDMRKLIKGVRVYIDEKVTAKEDFAFVKEVGRFGSKHRLDSVARAAIRNGAREWVSSSKARKKISQMLDKLEAIMADLLRQNPDETRRMPFVLRDIGYSDKGIKRLDAHIDLTTNGNKIMVLFARVAGLKELGKLYGNYIFLAFREEHAMAAECLFSMLARSYTSFGTGFNGIEAGRSCDSALHYLATQWNFWQKETLEETPVKENMAF
jgi:hypothetical protein